MATREELEQAFEAAADAARVRVLQRTGFAIPPAVMSIVLAECIRATLKYRRLIEGDQGDPQTRP